MATGKCGTCGQPFTYDPGAKLPPGYRGTPETKPPEKPEMPETDDEGSFAVLMARRAKRGKAKGTRGGRVQRRYVTDGSYD